MELLFTLEEALKEKGFFYKHNSLVTLLSTQGITSDRYHQFFRYINKAVRIRIISEKKFLTLLSTYYPSRDEGLNKTLENLALPDNFFELIQQRELYQLNAASLINNDAPIIKLINSILQEAFKKKASDIHIEPFYQHINIRFRIDGSLYLIAQLDNRLTHAIISRIKIMSKLDIAEKRKPQDGKFCFLHTDESIDIRVSSIPNTFSERIVLRILRKSVTSNLLKNLGFSEKEKACVNQLVREPNGLVLVTGPTGSGKTTTLYAFLSELASSEKNILTIEDPIEYEMAQVGQMQVNAQIGLTFSKGLRSILRQDPDIIMVGEIRDKETAEVAIEAALTGHLVFSTLHTNSAIGAITRLKEMNIQPYLISATVKSVISQRLLRVLCRHCKRVDPHAMAFRERFHLNHTLYTAAGCEQCNFTGYTGRQSVYEIILLNNTLRETILSSTTENQLMQAALKQTDFFDSLLANGLAQVNLGQTSFSELQRTIGLQ